MRTPGRILVLGAAVSGMAAARLGRRLGASVTVYDEDPVRASEAAAAGLAAVGGRWDRVLLEGIDLVVTSPGIPERAPMITDSLEAGIPVISELEFAWRQLDVPTVAVTGTNGKTTVTSMISRMLERSGLRAPALGNIGTPLSEAVGGHHDMVVVEASSFQLRFADTFHPWVAVVTNLAPDHLDWHPSFAAYAEAKANLVRRQEPTDVVVFDADDEGAVGVVARTPARRVPASAGRVPEGGVGVEGGRLRWRGLSVELARLARTDPVFLVDLAMAGAAALAAGADGEAVVEAAVAFRDPPHRRTVVGTRGGVTYVDESKATNPHAALAAIRAYPSVVLIAGGRPKGLDVGPLAREPNVRWVVAMGEAAPALLEAGGERVTEAGSMEEAVRIASRLAVPGDVVLLAPGCASFDMFSSYAERGDAFAEAVETIVGGIR